MFGKGKKNDKKGQTLSFFSFECKAFIVEI